MSWRARRRRRAASSAGVVELVGVEHLHEAVAEALGVRLALVARVHAVAHERLVDPDHRPLGPRRLDVQDDVADGQVRELALGGVPHLAAHDRRGGDERRVLHEDRHPVLVAAGRRAAAPFPGAALVDPHVAADDPHARVALQDLDVGGEVAGQPLVVVVEEGDELALRALDGDGVVPAETELPLVGEIPDARIVELLGRCAQAAAGIVGDDELEIGEVLVQDAARGGAELLGVPVRGHAD